jgi:hypothetical protein
MALFTTMVSDFLVENECFFGTVQFIIHSTSYDVISSFVKLINVDLLTKNKNFQL